MPPARAGEPPQGANPTAMGIRRAIGDLRELQQSVVGLFDDDRAAEAEASLQIARSAQRFSKNTKEVVDDKLSFSATLMRAGEVQAANRLLAEVEHEVREEEAALIETVNEVKVAQSMRRERVTRIRLARMLAVAALGSALLTFSAAGMAVAGFLRDRAESISRPEDNRVDRAAAAVARDGSVARSDRRSMRRLRIGDVDLLLTKSQFKTLKELTGGADIDTAGLQDLLSALPGGLADRIEEAITVADAEVGAAQADVETIAAATDRTIARRKRAAKKAAADAQAQEQETPAGDENATPEPTPSEQEKKEDTTTEEEEGGDSGEVREEEEGGDSGEAGEEEEGDGGPPLPIKP